MQNLNHINHNSQLNGLKFYNNNYKEVDNCLESMIHESEHFLWIPLKYLKPTNLIRNYNCLDMLQTKTQTHDIQFQTMWSKQKQNRKS